MFSSVLGLRGYLSQELNLQYNPYAKKPFGINGLSHHKTYHHLLDTLANYADFIHKHLFNPSQNQFFMQTTKATLAS
uniref:Uncharacterized protein n=1 Tax=Rhizophora mucronata TaxID=61149 RepID=A0A2P2Q5I8_RHIMU